MSPLGEASRTVRVEKKTEKKRERNREKRNEREKGRANKDLCTVLITVFLPVHRARSGKSFDERRDDDKNERKGGCNPVSSEKQ